MEMQNTTRGNRGQGRGLGPCQGGRFGRGQGRGFGLRFEDCPRLADYTKEELQAYKERLTGRLDDIDARLGKSE